MCDALIPVAQVLRKGGPLEATGATSYLLPPTPLLPTSNLSQVLRKGGTFEAAVGAASEGAAATKGMTAALGRSAYVPAENQSGVEDPGAMAVRIWMAAALKAISA